MATRFYLPSSGPAAITPAMSSEWDSTSTVESYCLVTSRSNSGFVTKGYDNSHATTPFDVARLRYVSSPLEAQTVTGTVKGQMRVAQSWADNDACSALVIKVVSNDGNTVRGTLLSYFPSSLTSEWATTLTNRYFPPSGTAVSSVDVQAGDRLVIEIGYRRFYTTYGSMTWRVGDNSASDLPEDESSTSDYNPWIEFSHTFDFHDELEVGQVLGIVEYDETPQVRVSHVGVQVEYTPTAPGQYTYTGDIRTTVSVASERDWEGVFTGGIDAIIGVEGQYSFQDGTDFIYTGNVPVVATVSGTAIRGRVAVGDLHVYMGVAGEYSSPIRVYVGNIRAEITPTASTSVPIPGWDKYTGYGVVQLDGLSENPPFWCIEEGSDHEVPIGVSPVANYSFYSETDLDTSGGLQFGGDLFPDEVEPSRVEFATQGGLEVAGKLGVERALPPVLSHATLGGMSAGGRCAFAFVDSSDIPVTAIITTGSLQLAGANAIEMVDPTVFVFEALLGGKLKLGGVRRPPVEHVVPTAADSDITEVAAGLSGILALAGTVSPIASLAEAYEVAVSGSLVVAGACTVMAADPVVVAVETEGGLVLEGEETVVFVEILVLGGMEGTVEQAVSQRQVSETWALTGTNFEPSIYSGFDFNSYAEHGGRYFAAGPDGIYLLEGDDDDGRAIHPEVRIGPTNLGTTKRKRLRTLYLQNAGNSTEVRVSGDTTGAESYHKVDQLNRVRNCNVVQDEALTLEIKDFRHLSQIEITPVVLTRR